MGETTNFDDAVRDRAAAILVEKRATEIAERHHQALIMEDHRNGESDQPTDGFDFFGTKPPNPEPIWGRGDQILWARGEGVLPFGSDGSRKSTLALHLVYGSFGADQGLVLGYPVAPIEDDRQIVVIAADRKRQLQRLGYAVKKAMWTPDDFDERLKRNLVVYPGRPPVPYNDSDRFQEWLHSIAPRAERLVVDSLKDIIVGSLKTDDTGIPISQTTNQLINGGVDVNLLGHDRKESAGGEWGSAKRDGAPELSDVYGSRYSYAGMGSVIGLGTKRGSDGKVIEFRQRKPVIEIVEMDVVANGVHLRLKPKNAGEKFAFWFKTEVVANPMHEAHDHDSANAVTSFLYEAGLYTDIKPDTMRRAFGGFVHQDGLWRGAEEVTQF